MLNSKAKSAKQVNRRPRPRKQAGKKKQPRSGGGYAFFGVLFVLTITALLMGFRLFVPAAEPPTVLLSAPPEVPARAAIDIAPTVSASAFDAVATQAQFSGYVVGIVAGHKGYDPGAVCDDGLTEAEVNYAISQEVVSLLARQGVAVHLLDEFDERLAGYQADSLVSIHADSCNIPGATGFKVARVTDSAIPDAEDLLVACLNQEYGRYTGLSQHPASITDNMTNYHAFREIAHTTPGAIIEAGFLLEDRYLLEYKPKILARGIAAGILCFLHNNNNTSAP